DVHGPAQRRAKRIERAPIQAQSVQKQYRPSLGRSRPSYDQASPADRRCTVLDPAHAWPPAFRRTVLSAAAQCASSSRATAGAIVKGKRCPPSNNVSNTGLGPLALPDIASTIADMTEGGVERSSA